MCFCAAQRPMQREPPPAARDPQAAKAVLHVESAPEQRKTLPVVPNLPTAQTGHDPNASSSHVCSAETSADAAGGAREASPEQVDWLVAEDRAVRGVDTAMSEASDVDGHS